jgi:hypothetical protein
MNARRVSTFFKIVIFVPSSSHTSGRRVRDRMVASWIYNYLCNRCLSLLMLWVRLPLRGRCTILCDLRKVGPPVSSTNKTDRHDKTEILLRVALSTIKPNQIYQVTQRLKEFAHIGKAYLSQADECKINFKILNHQLYVTM